MGTLAPSGSVVEVRCAVRLTVVTAAEAMPVTKSNDAAATVRIMAFEDLVFMTSLSRSRLIRFVDGVGRIDRIDQEHHHHSARKDIVGGDFALVMRMPHIGVATLR